MKRILITGANSYIGTYFERYIKSFSDIRKNMQYILLKKLSAVRKTYKKKGSITTSG